MSYADLRELQSALNTASDIAFSLDAAPAAHEADQLVDALRRALTAANALGAGTGATGCAEHPAAPWTPCTATRPTRCRRAGGGACCATTMRRRASAQRRNWR
ncbi:hypothetical protein ACFQ2B_36745 [Streptomyces stramineus]